MIKSVFTDQKYEDHTIQALLLQFHTIDSNQSSNIPPGKNVDFSDYFRMPFYLAFYITVDPVAY